MTEGSQTPAEAGRRRVRDPASTRARILAEAERLFAERGFAGVSMPAIAEAAGITPGAIYKHFDGKAELFFHVIRRTVEATPQPTTEASLPAAVAAYAAKPLKRLRQMAVEVHYAAAKDPQVRRLLRRSLDANIAAMADGLAGARAVGALDTDADPRLLATAVMVFIMGQMHLETLAPQLVGDPAWRALVEDRIAAMVGLPRGEA